MNSAGSMYSAAPANSMPELLSTPDDDVDEFLIDSIKKCATRSSPLKAFLKRPE